MVEVTHVVVVDELPESIGLFSPQLPGFVFGRDTQTELLADYKQALQRAGVRGRVEGHEQRYVAGEDGQVYAVRWSTDRHHEDRVELANRILHALEVEPGTVQRNVEAYPDDDTLIVCAMGTDTLEWVIDQLDARGEIANVLVLFGDAFAGVAIGTGEDRSSWQTIEELGWARDMTIDELITQALLKPASERRVSVTV